MVTSMVSMGAAWNNVSSSSEVEKVWPGMWRALMGKVRWGSSKG